MGSHTCSNPPDNCHGKRKTTVLCKGEEALTSSHSKTASAEDAVKSSHYKTISATKEVKVGKAILYIPGPFLHPRHLIPLLPRPLGAPLWQFPPEVQSPLVTSPHNTSQVWDIMVLKRAFPDSFDTFGNMPSTYTIRTDPSVPPVQHARWKVPIE